MTYSSNNRAYKVYNKHTQTIMESVNVIVDNGGPISLRRDDAEAKLSHSKVRGNGILDNNSPNSESRVDTEDDSSIDNS